jgi:hypothetical protein
MYEDNIMKPTKYCLKKEGGGLREYNIGHELIQRILFTSMESSS